MVLYRYFPLIALLFTINTYSQSQEVNNPITINNAIEIAIKNNQELKIASLKLKAVESRYLSALNLPKPEIGFSREFIPLGSGLSGYSEKSISIEQSFEFPLTYYQQFKINDLQTKVAEAEYNSEKNRLICRVKTAYYNLLALNKKYLIAMENMRIVKEFYDKSKIRYELGESTRLEMLTAKNSLAEAENMTKTLNSEIKSADSELNLILCRDLQITNSLSSDFEYEADDLSFEKVIGLAAGNNPEYLTEVLNHTKSEAEKTLSWYSLFPSFKVEYLRQQEKNSPSSYGVSFGLSVPLWFIFNEQPKIEEAEFNISISKENKNLSLAKLNNRIKSIINKVSVNREQVLLYRQVLIPQTEEILSIASNSYDSGEISYLEFLQAKQTTIDSKLNYLNALLEFNLSMVELQEAAGIEIK